MGFLRLEGGFSVTGGGGKVGIRRLDVRRMLGFFQQGSAEEGKVLGRVSGTWGFSIRSSQWMQWG
jgi:hypothetical protein